jgi:hypothetical protein
MSLLTKEDLKNLPNLYETEEQEDPIVLYPKTSQQLFKNPYSCLNLLLYETAINLTKIHKNKRMLMIFIKYYIAIALLALTLSANEIQVFSSKADIDIKVTQKSVFTKVYYGSAKEFYANPKKYLNDKTVKSAATFGLASVGIGAVSLAGGGSGKAGLYGLAGTAIASIGVMSYNWITSDNEYIYISTLTNPDGKTTLVYTLIVANNFISDKEGETLALANQKKL